uniref:(northern house mosquito) hypothetical protein n=1 Tax=Culex pipiens TaxID=7175 RepID=A0A8D8B6D3_CULPI
MVWGSFFRTSPLFCSWGNFFDLLNRPEMPCSFVVAAGGADPSSSTSRKSSGTIVLSRIFSRTRLEASHFFLKLYKMFKFRSHFSQIKFGNRSFLSIFCSSNRKPSLTKFRT